MRSQYCRHLTKLRNCVSRLSLSCSSGGNIGSWLGAYGTNSAVL